MDLGFLSSRFPWAVLWESGYWVKGYERFFLWLLLMIAKLLPQRLNRFVEHQLPGVSPEISSTEGQAFRSSPLPHDIRLRASPWPWHLVSHSALLGSKPSHDRANRGTAWLTQGPSPVVSLHPRYFSKNPEKLELYEEIINGEGEGGGEA